MHQVFQVRIIYKRMKKTAILILILFLAGLVGYGGGGINYINYCCYECEAEGVDAVIEDLCCETHGHDHVNFINEKGEIFQHDGDCLNCGLHRINFEWTDDNVHVPVIHIPSFDLNWIDSNMINLSPLFAELFVSDVQYTGPPVYCPRVYLSLLTVLLI